MATKPEPTHARIKRMLGCDLDKAIAIDLAARLLNKQESLVPVELLSEPQFAELVERAAKLDRALSASIRRVALAIPVDPHSIDPRLASTAGRRT